MDCVTWCQIREDSTKSNPEDRLSALTLERNAEEPGTCCCSFFMNKMPGERLEPTRIAPPDPKNGKNVKSDFSTFMGVQPSALKVSIGARRCLIFELTDKQRQTISRVAQK